MTTPRVRLTSSFEPPLPDQRTDMTANNIALLYLVASVLFILALKGLSSPVQARRGNQFGIVGMPRCSLAFTCAWITLPWGIPKT